ncbi:MAG: hypothetical protein Q9192_007267, partial [Flavoplaca navasiana]
MVLLKLTCPPERRKAVVAATLSTSSPTFSLSAEDSSAPLQIIITLRLENSTQPGRAITIRTGGTVFAPPPEGGGLDTLALGTFGPLISNSDPERRINLGQLKPHHLHTGEGPPSPNLKEREGIQFLTIPADGSAQVRHDLPISRIFEYEGTLTKEDLKPGDVYHLGINSGYLGTTWWCWGDMEGDLKDKKLSAWQEGINFGKAEKPTPEQVEKEG